MCLKSRERQIGVLKLTELLFKENTGLYYIVCVILLFSLKVVGFVLVEVGLTYI